MSKVDLKKKSSINLFGFSRGAFLLFLFCILKITLAHAAIESPLRLSDLLLRAKENQVDWRAATYSREKAQLNVIAARSQFLPDLGWRSQYSYDWQSSLLNQESVGSSAALVSKWSLYDNGSSIRNFKINQLQLDKQRLHESVVQNQVAYELTQRYLKYLLARRQTEITKAKLDLLEVQYRMTERQFRQGLKTRRDYQRLDSETERAKLNLLRQTDDIKNTFEELRRYMGDFDLLSEAQVQVVPIRGVLDRLEKNKNFKTVKQDDILSVRLAEFEKKVKAIEKQEAGAELWPTLSLGTEFGYGSNRFAAYGESWSDEERFFGLAQIQLNWNLWDWGGRRSLAEKARLEDRYSSLLHQQSQMDADTLLSRLLRENERLQKSLTVVRKIYQIELGTFQDIEKEYREGRSTYLDLITSLDRRTQAELDVEQESISMILNISQILQMTGALYETCLQI